MEIQLDRNVQFHPLGSYVNPGSYVSFLGEREKANENTLNTLANALLVQERMLHYSK